MKRILLIDSQPLMRKGIQAVLEGNMSSLELAEAENGSQAMRMLVSATWDLVILELALPDVHWVDFIPRMKLKAPRIPILTFSRYPEEHFGTRCVKLGAAGYVTMSVDPDTFAKAVREVMNRGIYVSPKLAEMLALEASHQSAAQFHDDLSSREYQIFSMLTSGIRVTEIADQLMLSVKTVSTHRKRILAKMGMKNNAELTHYAQTIGLLV